MITRDYLEKIGFLPEDAQKIVELNSIHSNKIADLVEEYEKVMKDSPFLPYEGDGRNESEKRTDAFIEEVQKRLPELHEKTARLLGWINCIPKLGKKYKKHGIDEDVFFRSMRDFTYKVKECRDVYGILGLNTNWFFLFFDLKMFALGRLQYEVTNFWYDEYSKSGYELKKGDKVYFCHIPSSGKLTKEDCMDSFQKAYDFFKPQLEGDIIPIFSHTWLFYKPYIGKVFSEGTNLYNFIKLFDITDSISTGDNFKDCWRVFNKKYEGTTCGLKADNSLRKKFVKYIDDGGDFGEGFGIVLYDGKKGKIVNID